MPTQHGPWTINSSEIKYKNPWIEVIEDQVTRPDGKLGIFGTIKMKAGVSVLPLDDCGNVYLTEEFHYAVGTTHLECVSGALDDGETPIEAARRELKEELGIEAGEWIDLGLVNPFTTVINSPANLFVARKLTFGKAETEGTEQIKVVKMKFEDAVRKVMNSAITHGPTCVLILKAKRFFSTPLQRGFERL